MMHSMRQELEKIAEGTSTAEAVEALRRLKELEANKPSASQIARGAVAGTAAGLAAQVAREGVSGGLKKGIGEALKAPTVKGKLWGLGKGALTNLGATAAGSAAFGATLPMARQYLDSGAEKARLREYLGTSKRGRTRREVAKVLGVG